MSWLKRASSKPRPARPAPLQCPFPAGLPGDQFDVLLTAAGDRKIQVIKVIRECTGYGVKESKDLVDGAAYRPVVITAALPLSAANQVAAALTRAGAAVTVTVTPPAEPTAQAWPY